MTSIRDESDWSFTAFHPSTHRPLLTYLSAHPAFQY
jgi:hypothetical protein